MFQVNDTVLYGGQSVCTIIEISRQKVGKDYRMYYILKPVFDNKSTVYIPCENETLVSKMKPLMTLSEVRELIETLHKQSLDWVENDILRKEQYSEILYCGDRKKIASLIRTLYLHKEKQKQTGKKFHITDEQLFERAQKLLHEEIAFLLNIHPNDVPDFIEAQLQSDNINYCTKYFSKISG